MHNNVTFSVNLSDGLTDTFKSSIGVKQGCILIPTIFSLYINDLADSFGNDCDPLDLNGKLVSCLLYADDIVLLSESAQGLQNLLNKVKMFCDKWNLQVNINKSEVMIFNKSGKILKGHNFLYDGNTVSLVNEYKYLGIIFKPSGTIFCIRKSLCSENMNVVLHIKLFDSCVKPILLYCSEI
jgi:hypothetical protein